MFLTSRFSTCPSTNNDAARPLLRGSGPKIEALIPYCANLEPSSIQLLHTLPPQDIEAGMPEARTSFAQALQRLRPGAEDKP
jgi:hypothetical protein